MSGEPGFRYFRSNANAHGLSHTEIVELEVDESGRPVSPHWAEAVDDGYLVHVAKSSVEADDVTPAPVVGVLSEDHLHEVSYPDGGAVARQARKQAERRAAGPK